jgi:SsrA-binding protein
MEKKINILNKRARFDYEFVESYTAGVVLNGVEVKLIRKGHLSFVDSFCSFQNGELFMKNVSISGIGTENDKRDRKLLLKKRELNKIRKDMDKGLSIIPSKLYENDRGRFKIEIILGRGKKSYDKRETIKSRDVDREIRRNQL